MRILDDPIPFVEYRAKAYLEDEGIQIYFAYLNERIAFDVYKNDVLIYTERNMRSSVDMDNLKQDDVDFLGMFALWMCQEHGAL